MLFQLGCLTYQFLVLFENKPDMYRRFSYINAVDMETWMTPVKTLDMSQVTSPIVQVDKALETKIETADADTATDVVQV